MNVQQVLVFDGDDTLWFVEPLYDEAHSKARSLVESSGLDGGSWEARQRILDVSQRHPTRALS